MSTRDEDEAWRAIVENYGERAVIDDRRAGADENGSTSAAAAGPATAESSPGEAASAELDPYAPEPRSGLGPHPDPTAPPTSTPASYFGPEPFDPRPGARERGAFDAEVNAEHSRDEGRFVPPRPEMPQMPPSRWAAWICVLGSPVLFVISAMLSSGVSGWFAGLLTLCFLGGFGWLVATMPTDPRDPWDDGSRV